MLSKKHRQNCMRTQTQFGRFPMTMVQTINYLTNWKVIIIVKCHSFDDNVYDYKLINNLINTLKYDGGRDLLFFNGFLTNLNESHLSELSL